MIDEQRQLVDLGAGPPAPCGDQPSGSDPLDGRRHLLDVMRVVVLPIDKQDLLRPPGDIELIIKDYTDITGIDPIIGRSRGLGGGTVAVVTCTDGRATDPDIPDATR